MQVTRFTKARPYEAPEHFGMSLYRLQGKDASDTLSVWVACSNLLPGGRTALSASRQEKIYLCISGNVTFTNGSDEVALGPLDSVRFAPDEPRGFENRGAGPATVVLIMQNEAKEPSGGSESG
jgi:quercetin dioxygenase-like cupin family protein